MKKRTIIAIGITMIILMIVLIIMNRNPKPEDLHQAPSQSYKIEYIKKSEISSNNIYRYERN